MIPAAVLDRCVTILMARLYTDCLEAERLIRMGAHGLKEHRTAAARLGYGSTCALTDRLRSLDLPPSGVLLMWGRLLLAMYLWEPTAKANKGAPVSLDEVAIRFGWCNNGVISNSLLHHAGIRPRAWHLSRETFDHLCHRFVNTWREREREEAAA